MVIAKGERKKNPEVLSKWKEPIRVYQTQGMQKNLKKDLGFWAAGNRQVHVVSLTDLINLRLHVFSFLAFPPLLLN